MMSLIYYRVSYSQTITIFSLNDLGNKRV